mgnify:CR=1 FL=1
MDIKRDSSNNSSVGSSFSSDSRPESNLGPKKEDDFVSEKKSIEGVKKGLNNDSGGFQNKEFEPERDNNKDKDKQKENNNKKDKFSSEPYIRTMERDADKLKKGGNLKTAPPPSKLPTEDSDFSSQETADKKLKDEVNRNLSSMDVPKPDKPKDYFEGLDDTKKEKITEDSSQDKDSELFKKKDFESPENRLKFPEDKSEKNKEDVALKEEDKDLTKDRVPAPPSDKKQKPKTSKKSYKKVIIISIGSFILIAGIGGFFYWWNYLKVTPSHYECRENKCVSIEGEGQDSCSINSDCREEEPEPKEPQRPDSLISTDETRILEIQEENLNQLLYKVKEFTKDQETNSLTRLLIKVSGNSSIYYLNLDNLTHGLGINIFNDIMWSSVASSEIEAGNYTLLSYSQNNNSRLGLVVELTEGESKVREMLSQWEKDMVKDLGSLLLVDDIPESATESFQDNTYKEVPIRYINFPDSDLTIDYAVVDDKLVITTSKASMFEVIDRLTVGK